MYLPATGVAGEQGPYGHCHEGNQAERAGPVDEPPGHVREGESNLGPAEAAVPGLGASAGARTAHGWRPWAQPPLGMAGAVGD